VVAVGSWSVSSKASGAGRKRPTVLPSAHFSLVIYLP
jgi:hypothetical protein